MTTIMQEDQPDGTTRRCDARCHDAKGAVCNCICGGPFHGLGWEGVSAKMLQEEFDDMRLQDEIELNIDSFSHR